MANTVFYSVCPFGTGDLKVGLPTITISSGVATLSTNQSNANIGVGCCIEYGSDKVYISQINSGTSFNVTTRLGAAPNNCENISVVGIYHPFDSLYDAEAQIPSASYDYLKTSSLVTADVQLNIVCYKDHVDGTADTGGNVTISLAGDATRYLKVYTPTLNSEAFLDGHRHNGIWSTTAYVHANTLWQYSPWSQFVGLQVSEPSGVAYYIGPSSGASSTIRCYNNIFRILNSTVKEVVLFNQIASSTTVYFYNNVIYQSQASNTANWGIALQAGYDHTNCVFYIENCTIHAPVGMYRPDVGETDKATVYVKNVLVKTIGFTVTEGLVAFDDQSGVGWGAGSGYNACEDDTAPGSTGNHENLDLSAIFAEDFVDYRTNPEDSNVIGQATNTISSGYSVEISWFSTTVPWDIWAFVNEANELDDIV